MRFGTVAIDFEGALKGAVGVVGALLAEISFADAQVEIGQVRVGAFGFEQAGEGGVHVAFFELNDAHEQIGPGAGLYFGFRTGFRLPGSSAAGACAVASGAACGEGDPSPPSIERGASG